MFVGAICDPVGAAGAVGVYEGATSGIDAGTLCPPELLGRVGESLPRVDPEVRGRCGGVDVVVTVPAPIGIGSFTVGFHHGRLCFGDFHPYGSTEIP